MDIAKLVPIDALPGLGAGATNAIVGIVFLVLWRQYQRSHLLAFGLSFGGVAVAVLLGAVEHITGRLPWRDYVADGAYISAGFLLFAGCLVLAGRRAPATALTIGAILTYIAAELILLTLGIAPILYLPELVAFLYLWIAYLFLSRPQLAGNRVLGYLFAVRGAVNLPWFWEFTHGLIPYSNVIDQILIVSIGWALVLTELFRATEQNARLYRDLSEREAKIRRLVDANIIGIFIADLDGPILEANDAFLRIVGYDREDLLAGRLRWTDLTPSDWRERDAQWIEEHRRTGLRSPIEKEYFRKDGSRVPILLGSATVEEGGNQAVTFVLDLTERKRAEAEARESERRYRETQMQLAHANRVATMGQLTASIAHEVNQPITATVTNAQAALRFLSAPRPDLDEVRESLDCIVKDGDRAGAVLGRIRALIKGAPPRDECVEINAAIREVIELTRSEAMKNGVLVQTELVDGLPAVRGDRVELQQVILNLILNALEAMSAMSERSREVLVSAGTTEAGDVLVAVRDSGPGLTPTAPEDLFRAFYTTKPNGLGLGLSICRSIIEGHGGRLWAGGNSPRGAVFQFTLPAEPAAPKPEENQALPTPRQ